MYRPIFSASHSSKLIEHAQRSAEVQRVDDWRQFWAVQGVSAHGEVWSQADVESMVDEHAGMHDGERDEQDNKRMGDSDPDMAGHSSEHKTADSRSHARATTYKKIMMETPVVAGSTPLPVSTTTKMAVNYWWISLWFVVTIPVIFWDAGYCLLRPRSMVGGDLHWIWAPYSIYQEVDYIYGVKALQEGNGFTNAQSVLNLVENVLNIVYLWLAHVSGSPVAPVIGFTSVVMTLSKTVLYWLQEYFCGGCSVGHNDFNTLLVYWIIPNGVWLVFPSLIAWRLGKDLAASVTLTAKAEKKKASGKKQ
ncbi:hypothetical protein BDW22DRAFT_1427735 [Trametopsis cervina]|nr:hypothetical protein BDW22DRAFT_1427735 [Trametopsis cervina]